MEGSQQFEGQTSPLEEDLHRVVQRARQVLEGADRGADVTVQQRAVVAEDLERLLAEAEQHKMETDDNLRSIIHDARDLLDALRETK